MCRPFVDNTLLTHAVHIIILGLGLCGRCLTQEIRSTFISDIVGVETAAPALRARSARLSKAVVPPPADAPALVASLPAARLSKAKVVAVAVVAVQVAGDPPPRQITKGRRKEYILKSGKARLRRGRWRMTEINARNAAQALVAAAAGQGSSSAPPPPLVAAPPAAPAGQGRAATPAEVAAAIESIQAVLRRAESAGQGSSSAAGEAVRVDHDAMLQIHSDYHGAPLAVPRVITDPIARAASPGFMG